MFMFLMHACRKLQFLISAAGFVLPYDSLRRDVNKTCLARVEFYLPNNLWSTYFRETYVQNEKVKTEQKSGRRVTIIRIRINTTEGYIRGFKMASL